MSETRCSSGIFGGHLVIYFCLDLILEYIQFKDYTTAIKTPEVQYETR